MKTDQYNHIEEIDWRIEKEEKPRIVDAPWFTHGFYYRPSNDFSICQITTAVS